MNLKYHPEAQTQLSDLYQEASETRQINLGDLITKHLINGQTSDDQRILDILARTKTVLQKLA